MMNPLLIVGDSAALDTGYGRVIREIGAHLHVHCGIPVEQVGMHHRETKRAVPFKIHGVSNQDAHGLMAMSVAMSELRPRAVLFVDDRQAVDPIMASVRIDCPKMWYSPIDGHPVDSRHVNLANRMDAVIAFGGFGTAGIVNSGGPPPVASIPHGVGDVFSPMTPDRKMEVRARYGIPPNAFVVGTVARNTFRKNLPALVKAFRAFAGAWWRCTACQDTGPGQPPKRCASCGGADFTAMPGKKDALLYMHTVPNDSQGHDLSAFCRERGVRCVFPRGVREGVGCSDTMLAETYNTFDMFVLPTMAEGFGMPVLESLACGIPALVTDYSGHLDFCGGACETIEVESWITSDAGHSELAIVSVQDMVVKMDRMYMSPVEFLDKWKQYLMSSGMSEESLASLPCGASLRANMSEVGCRRAEDYRWSRVLPAWGNLMATLGLTASQ